MKIAVSELIVRFLQRLGIEYIFGIPGAHILPVYDSLYDSGIKTVLTKHEQGAAFMAGGYARVSGKVAACIATAGPGATNLVTGIANAYADRQPILVITGETSTYIFGRGGLQESSGEGGSIDQAALFQGIVRYHKTVERTDYLAHVLNRAAKILRSPKPGPVALSLPYNVQQESVDPAILDGIGSAADDPASARPERSVSALGELIDAARHPVILAGHGCFQAGAGEVLAGLSERLGIPVATSLKAKGLIDEGTALSLGSLGVTSNGQAYRYIVTQADLVIFLGVSFNERTSYLWDDRLLAGKRLAQVDLDPEQLGRVFKPDVALEGDVKAILTALAQRYAGGNVTTKDLRPFLAHIQDARHRARSEEAAPAKFALAESFFSRLAARFPQEALIFDDNIIFAQRYFNVSRGNRYFPNSGISALGHAIPAAIGARFHTRQPTFAILGDGGFQMCAMEIMTAVNYGIPLNIVVFNNSTMGLIRKNQFQLYRSRFIDCDFINPDLGLLARSFRIHHRRIDSEDDLDRLFAEDDLTGAINLIEIMLDKNAFPDYLSNR